MFLCPRKSLVFNDLRLTDQDKFETNSVVIGHDDAASAVQLKDDAMRNLQNNSSERFVQEPKLLSLPEFRRRLGNISRATAYRWEKKGLIKLTRIGGRTLVSEAEIARLAGSKAA